MRTLIKTLSYKTLTTLELAAIAWLLTGSFEVARSLGLLHLAVSSLTFAGFDHLFEWIWKGLGS